jgi:hypothetical protein
MPEKAEDEQVNRSHANWARPVAEFPSVTFRFVTDRVPEAPQPSSIQHEPDAKFHVVPAWAGEAPTARPPTTIATVANSTPNLRIAAPRPEVLTQ